MSTKSSVPKMAHKGPFPIEAEKGSVYFWCACGNSKTQPLCDGSHKGTGINPVRYQATESRTLYFCGCKHSQESPLCDGTHSTL